MNLSLCIIILCSFKKNTETEAGFWKLKTKLMVHYSEWWYELHYDLNSKLWYLVNILINYRFSWMDFVLWIYYFPIQNFISPWNVGITFLLFVYIMYNHTCFAKWNLISKKLFITKHTHTREFEINFHSKRRHYRNVKFSEIF